MKKKLLSILLCLCMVMALLPTTALAAGEGAGSTSISNFKELKDAFRDGGEYTLAANITVTEQLTLESGKTLTIHGNGHTIQPEVTGLNEQGIVNDDASAIDNIIKNSGTLTLENLTIYGGNGRCIANNSYGTLTMTGVSLERAHFIGRYEFDFGAGLYNSGSAKALLTNCNIRRNGCDRSGGGFYNAGTLILESCAIVENRNFGNNKGGGAGENSGASGSTAQLYMNNCTVANNQSSEIGGGLNNFSGTAYIMNSTFTGNVTTKTYDYYGGGIGNNQGKVYAVNSAFAFNYANGVISDIGIYNSSNKDVFLYNCAYGTIRKSPSSDPQSSFVSACQKLEGEVSSLFNGARNSGIVDKNGVEDTSTTFDRPVITSVGSTYGVYPAAAESSALKFGAVKTYYECDSTNFTVKMSYGDGESPTQLGNLGTTRTAVTRPGGGDTSSLIGAMPANFAITTMYTVKVKPATGGTVTGGSAQGNSYPAGTTGIQITAVPSTGYAFSGWKVNGATDISEPNKTYTINDLAGDVALTPVFVEANTYTVTYLPGTNGTGDKKTDTKTKDVDLPLRVVTFTRTGYTQTGWATSDGGEKVYALGGTYSANADASLYPVWTANTYTVTWKSQDGTSTLETDEGVTSGTAPSFGGAAPTKDQDDRYTYTFDGWADSENQESGTDVGELPAVTDNVTYYAAFSKTARNYTVTLHTNDGTIADGKDVTSYTYGTPVTLPGVADMTKAGYTFGGWYDNESLSGGAVTAIAADATGNKTFYAKWTPIPATTPTLETVSGLSLTYGYPAGSSLSVTVTNSDADHTYTYQWYSNTSDSNTDGTPIYGETGSSYTIPTGKSAGTTEYYYCVVTATRTDNGQTATAPSNAAKLEVGKLTITVTAEPKSSRVGQDLVPLTYTYTPELIGSDAFTGALATDADKDAASSSYTITQGTLALSNNYTLVFNSGTYSVVTKEPQNNFKFAEATQTKTYGDADFTVAATGAETGSTVTYASSDTSVATVDNSGKVQILKVGTATITATASETTTHAQATATYTLTVNKKEVAVPTADTTEFTYNGNAHTYTLTANDAYTVTNNVQTAAKESGYTVTVHLNDTDNTKWAGDGDDIADKTYTFIIHKATITVTANNQSIYVNDAAPALGEGDYTVSGLATGENLKTLPTIAYASTPDMTKAGTVSITVSGAEAPDGGNYNDIVYVSGTLTISARPSAPSSGGSYTPPTYKVDIQNPENANGTVSAKPGTARAGTTVTITVTPDEGYALDSLIVKNQTGKELDVTDNGDGTYTFKMPAGKVTVEPVFSWDNPFADVAENAYYAPAVEWALKNDITDGVDAAHFAPNASCTRAQIVTFLWRAAGCPAPKSSTMPFTDVKAGSYYETAVLWAVENGITKGTGDTTFSPNATCSRAQIVSFLYRAASSPAVSGSAVFTDVSAGSYYANAVAWAVENGITGGTGNNAFSPNADCTRAQIVSFLYRWMVK